jgi:hypothetical protein
MKNMRPLALLLGALVCSSALAQSGAPADVPKDHWAFSAVDNLFRAGILKGYPDGNFRGSRPATRFEMASMLNNLYRLDSSSELQRQIDELKSRQGGEVRKSDTEELRQRLDSLRVQVTAMRRQREDIDSLNVTFKGLNDQLQQLRNNLHQMHEDLGKVKRTKS